MKHSAWSTFQSTRPTHAHTRSGEPKGTESSKGETTVLVGDSSNENICARCLKPLDGRVVETLDGDRVHGECYVRGGRR